jgi:glutathione peroxidase
MNTIKFFLLIFAIMLSFSVFAQHKTLFDFKAKTIDGDEFDFSSLKGKKVLIVNTATKCSLSPQLKRLQEIYEEYGGDDFEILAFPSNDFGNQEPGTNEDIKEVCFNKYGITFQLMEKVKIKGDDCHPLYHWLTTSEENGSLQARVTWNFQKFLIDKNGEVVDALSPIASPKSNRIIEWLME